MEVIERGVGLRVSTSLVPPAAKGCRDVCRDNGRTGRGAEAEEASECVIEASRGLRWIGGLCVWAGGGGGDWRRRACVRGATGRWNESQSLPDSARQRQTRRAGTGLQRQRSGSHAAVSRDLWPSARECTPLGRLWPMQPRARRRNSSRPESNGWAESTRRKLHPGAVMMFGAPNRLMTSGSELDLSANWQVWGSARMTKQPWRLGSPKDKTRPHGEKTGNAASRQKSSNWPWAAFQAFAAGPLWLGTAITHTTAQTCYRSLSILVTLPRRAKTTHASNHPTHSLAD